MDRRFLKQRRRGDAIVEFALVLPMLLLILFGILEIGRVLDAWIVVENAAREGARAGSLAGPDVVAIPAAQNAANGYLQTAFSSRTDIDQTLVPAPVMLPDSVNMTVQADVHIYTPLMQAILKSAVRVRGTAVMPR